MFLSGNQLFSRNQLLSDNQLLICYRFLANNQFLAEIKLGCKNECEQKNLQMGDTGFEPVTPSV